MAALYTTHDVAKLLQVDASTIAKWIDKGTLLAFRTPGGHRRVRASDLRAFCEHHQMPVPRALQTGTLRVLAVDDEKTALSALQRSLKPLAERVELSVTTSAIDAILSAMEESWDAIIIDVNMEQLDGLEVLRRLRSRPALSNIKLVAASSAMSPALAEEARRAGAHAVLEKPINLDAVTSVLGLNVAAARQ